MNDGWLEKKGSTKKDFVLKDITMGEEAFTTYSVQHSTRSYAWVSYEQTRLCTFRKKKKQDEEYSEYLYPSGKWIHSALCWSIV